MLLTVPHRPEIRPSRGKRGGYNVVCSECGLLNGPHRDREAAETAGRQHQEEIRRELGIRK